MKKIVAVLVAVILFLSFIPSAFADDFDYNSVLGSRNGYSYDKFTKTWKWYQAYVEEYRDGNVVIGMDCTGENGSSNPTLTTIYAKVLDNNGDNMRTVKSIAFLIGDDLYSYDSLLNTDFSSTTILGAQGQLLIKAIAECNASDVAVKIGTDKGDLTIEFNSTELTNTLKEFCRVYTKYNIWDYYTDRSLSEDFEKAFPLSVNGISASELLENN